MTDEAMVQFWPLLPPEMHGDYAGRDPSAASVAGVPRLSEAVRVTGSFWKLASRRRSACAILFRDACLPVSGIDNRDRRHVSGGIAYRRCRTDNNSYSLGRIAPGPGRIRAALMRGMTRRRFLTAR